jgi:hypothetical protein
VGYKNSVMDEEKTHGIGERGEEEEEIWQTS